jgi:hypothetical protein
MAQSNYNVPNDSAPAVRAQLNTVFGSVASNNSGTTAPGTTFAYQWWYDTTTDILKMRNAADSGWIDVAEFDQGTGEVILTGVPQLTQLQAEDDESEVFGVVSGERLAQAVAANLPAQSGLGVGQTWQAVTRSEGTSYQNLTGQPIAVAVTFTSDAAPRQLQVSTDGSTWVTVIEAPASSRADASVVVPDTHYYRLVAGATVNLWRELR